MNEVSALLAILSALVAALVWMVKATSKRSDRLIEQRDRENARLIDALEKAVDSFKTFEIESGECFGKLLDRMDSAQQTQELVVTELRAMRERLPAKGEA